MNRPLGVVLIALGAATAIGLGVIWRRLALRGALAAMAVVGGIVGAGASLVQDEVEAAEWVVTLLAFVVLTPVQAHLLLSERER